MSAMGIIISKMVLCLLAALLIGFVFGLLFIRARTKEYYEDKIDALEELCEAKKQESAELRTKYGNMDVEMSRLKENLSEEEEKLTALQKRNTEYETKLQEKEEEIELLEKKIETLQQEKEQEIGAKVAEREKEITEALTQEFEEKEKSLLADCAQKEEKLKAEIEQGFHEKIASLEESLKRETEALTREFKEKEEKLLASFKAKEEEMLEQLELLAEKTEKLQQKSEENRSDAQSLLPAIDMDEIMKRFDEVTTLLREKREQIGEVLHDEIEKEVKSLKEEVVEDKSGKSVHKIATTLKNIFKRIKS